MKWIFKIEPFFRLTDPEILERRYPVWLKEFHLRSDSGGNGLYKGGDGVVRVIQFLKKLTLSVLTDRRVISPYGLNEGMISRVFFFFSILIGIFWFHEFFSSIQFWLECFHFTSFSFLGQNGQKGLNLLTRHSDQVIVNLGGKSSVNVEAGDIFTLKTPGGGGWGNPLPVW